MFGKALPTQYRRGRPVCYDALENPVWTVLERDLAGVRLNLARITAMAPRQGPTGPRGGRGRLALVGAAVVALGLCGCGRVGPLEPPPGPASTTPLAKSQLTMPDGSPVPGTAQDTAMKTGFDAQGNPVATPGQQRPFLLDPLLR